MNATTIATIDELGLLKARIADLLKREQELKDRLSDLGPGAYEGDCYRLSIAETVRETLDMTAVRKVLPHEFIQQHTRITEYLTFRVSARNGRKVLS